MLAKASWIYEYEINIVIQEAKKNISSYFSNYIYH